MKHTAQGGMSTDFVRFKEFMRRLVAVPHSEIKAKLDAEKRARASASRAPIASSRGR